MRFFIKIVMSFLYAFLVVHLDARPVLYRDGKVLVVSVPKAGTHLVTKCLTLFQQPGLAVPYFKDPKPTQEDFDKYDKLNTLPPPNNYKGRFDIVSAGDLPQIASTQLKRPSRIRLFWTHWPYTKVLEQLIEEISATGFIVIRDPRDVVVSMAYMIHKNLRTNELMDPIKIMEDLIDGRQQNYIKWGVEINEAYPLMFDKGVTGFFQMYLPWLSSKNFMTVKFEDLVGSKGGGSDELQNQTIKDMSTHVRANLSDDAIHKVQQELFGDSGTFRKGLIGSWKEHFTQEMKAAFKKVPDACKLLIDLGYEKDANW